MPLVVFDRKVTRRSEPTVSLTNLGRFALNTGAASLLTKAGAEYVLLLWDPEAAKVGIKVIGKKEPRAYVLHFGKNGNGAGFSATTFVNFIKYDFSESRSFPLEWDETSNMFTFSIPKEHLTGSPKNQKGELGKLQRSDRAKAKEEKELQQNLTQ
jgi:hypothetical protein